MFCKYINTSYDEYMIHGNYECEEWKLKSQTGTRNWNLYGMSD